MTHWLIAKTDPNKEFRVAQALTDLGHTVWVPTQVATGYEKFSAGPGVTLRRKKAVERPLMPSVMFVDIDSKAPFFVALRHFQGFWMDCLEVPRLIPGPQIEIFRARVDAVNAAEIARIKKAQMGKRKAKRTLKIDPNLADELKTMLFGQQQEAA